MYFIKKNYQNKMNNRKIYKKLNNIINMKIAKIFGILNFILSSLTVSFLLYMILVLNINPENIYLLISILAILTFFFLIMSIKLIIK